MNFSRSTLDLRAVALVAGPILLALVVFIATERTGSDEGVYVEGANQVVHRLTTHADGRELKFTDIAAAAAAIPEPGIISFYVVGTPGMELSMPASAALYMLVVDQADPTWMPTFTQVEATVSRINPRAYRVRAARGPIVWRKDSPAYMYYRDVLAETSVRRATTDLVVALVVTDGQGAQRMFPVRLGPVQPPS